MGNLRCNLDGIILIKFCVLCLKVSILATVLCICVILPVNFTAEHSPEQAYNNTNTYSQTTFANIPDMFTNTNTTWYRIDGLFTNAFTKETTGITIRMLTILCVAVVLYTYTCVLIWEEWIQNLALRRVYYLEFNHYKDRKEELERLDNLNYPEDIKTTDRPVWVPHPDLRDCVPNIGLYSVLFRLPGVQLDTATCASDSNVGHQLQVAIDFFDKVVPNQPGYSSSVAALTILPDVKRLSQAWKKWFECASKVRRLKFIRQRLQQVRHEGQNLTNGDIDSHQYDEKSSNSNNDYDNDTELDTSRSQRKDSLENLRKLETVDEGVSSELFIPGGKDDTIYDTTDDISKYETDKADDPIVPMTQKTRYAFPGNELEKSRILALTEANEESNMEMFLDDDEIEQMTVYYREFARSSASCGPHGCDEYSILKADVITLADLEQEAAEDVHFAIEELRQARIEIRADKKPKVSQFHSIDEISSNSFSDEEDHLENLYEDRKVSMTDNSHENEIQRNTTNSHLWEEAVKLVGSEQYMFKRGGQVRKRTLNTGRWYNPFRKSFSSKASASKKVVGNQVPSGILSRIIESESYAVVTFTSRQATICARQCLADGSGLEGWKEIDKIPIPPLADAVPWNIFDCRGCCRPVTVTLPREQKRSRYKILVVIMIIFTALWTYPFVYLLIFTTPDKIRKLFSHSPLIVENAERLSALVMPLLMICFFAVLPQIFKAFANFGSGATSIQEAERHALFYYWWFMLIFAFGGTSLATLVIAAFQNNDVTVSGAQHILNTLGNALPVITSWYWTTWIIAQNLMVLPFMYFLQFNNFLFTALRWNCGARATAGGGPGGVVPYRIYVNVGVIFLCVVALAPLNPVLAPFAMMYLLFIGPMLKWSHIFVYRPTFDAGGMRWPLLHDIMMIALIVAQAVLFFSFLLKKAYFIGFLALLSIIPTWTFKNVCKETFEQSYNDAALLQTSELDGWNVDEETSMAERERYRKWLVDCHKASYVPICVNAEDNFLTSEPAGKDIVLFLEVKICSFYSHTFNNFSCFTDTT